jgi:hypothetical protein
MKTIQQLHAEHLELKKKALIKSRKPYTRKEEKRADSNDYYFDRETFRIIRKGQIELALFE